ncbi:MAG: tyrosine-type recombinase/integrase [Clostridia bacterium]|nr:tyrosine-type recombinase/integrase [Clostridia bacterium]
MAEIEKRISKDGKITFRIKVFKWKDVNGKKITESTTFTPTKKTPKAMEKEVQEFAREYEKKVKEEKILSGEKLTLIDVVEEWKQDQAYKDLTKAVQESYVDILERRIFPHIGNLKIAKITSLHIQKIYNTMEAEGKAPTTIKRTNAVLRSVMKYACRVRIIHENPCGTDWIRLPKIKADTDLHYFTLDQANRFLNSLSEEYTIEHPEVIRKNGRKIPAYTETITTPFQYVPFFYLAIYGGFRRGEILALTWNDIDFKNRTVSITKAITKTKEGQFVKETKTVAGNREIMLPSQCFEVLKEWKLKQMELAFSMGKSWKGEPGKNFDNNFIFIQLENGLRMDVDTPTHKFKKAIENYNSACTKEEDKLPLIHLHELRHTSATLLLANNVDIETVSHRLGHSKPSITLDVYGHWMKETDKTASDTLENLFNKKSAI